MKQNGEYFQPDEGISFPIDDNDVSDTDSDAKQLFELPKRKVIRPPSISLKRRVGTPNCW